MEAESEIEREGAFWKVNNIALWGVDENFVSKKVKAEFFEVDFFAFFELCGSFLELGNPEEVGWEMLDFPLFVVFCEFLFIVIKTGGKTAFGVFVHLLCADLEFDNFFVFGDDGGVEGLVTVLFRDGDVIFDALVHRGIERMKEAEGEITTCYIGNNDAKSG